MRSCSSEQPIRRRSQASADDVRVFIILMPLRGAGAGVGGRASDCRVNPVSFVCTRTRMHTLLLPHTHAHSNTQTHTHTHTHTHLQGCAPPKHDSALKHRSVK